ncbi:mocs3, partial [Symbiodinium natans]
LDETCERFGFSALLVLLSLGCLLWLRGWLQLACRLADKSIKRLCRRDRNRVRGQRVHELHFAWQARDFATCWKLSRLLSGRRLGPKKRLFSAPSVCCGTDEWISYLRRPGADGGCSAAPRDWQIGLQQHCDPLPCRLRACDLTNAAADLSSIGHLFRSCKLRKASPSWSFPASVWRMLFYSGRFATKQKVGLGASPPPVVAPSTRRCIFWLLVCIRARGCTPLVWHATSAFTIGKHNGKSGCAGQRLLHGLDSFSKHFFLHVWRQAGFQVNRPYAYGYAKGRRREHAIMQQSVLCHRLDLAGCSRCTDFFDAANAFASPSHAALLQFVQAASPDKWTTQILQQRLADATLFLQCADGQLVLGIGSGTLPGDSIACEWFLGVYHQAVDRFAILHVDIPQFVASSTAQSLALSAALRSVRVVQTQKSKKACSDLQGVVPGSICVLRMALLCPFLAKSFVWLVTWAPGFSTMAHWRKNNDSVCMQPEYNDFVFGSKWLNLCALAALTSLESYIGAVQSNPLVLFTGPDIRDAFLRADPAILLAARCSIAIPPPGYEPLPGQMQCLKNHTSVASLTPRQGWNVVLTSVPTKHWFYIRLNLAGPSMASVSWHMFLRYPISVFFVDLSLRVNGLLPSTLPAHLSVVFVRPGRAAWWYTSTSACLPISARSASWTLMTSSWLKTICSGICLPTLKCGSSTRVAMDTAFHQAFGAPPAPSAAAAREGGPSKVRVVTADKEATAIAEHALKMAVVVEQQLRLTQAAAFRSLPLPVSSEYFKYLQQAYAQYTAQTKGNKGHGLGPPDTFNAAALVDDKAKFDEFLASCKPGSKPAKLAVLLYRCEKMYGNTHKRLLLRLRDHDLEDLLVKHIECTGVEEFHGQRPAGYLANTAQTLLDSRK